MFCYFFVFVQPCLGFEYLLLESSTGKPLVRSNSSSEGGLIIEGNRALLKKRFTAASTFKIVLAAAALEEGLIQADTRVFCSDNHIRRCPKSLNLHQALVFSSNDYFKRVINLLGEQKVKDYAAKLLFFPQPIPNNWLKGNLHSAVWAGTMKLTPEDQHQFMGRLIRGELPIKPETRRILQNSLVWPSPDSSLELIGKTGSMQKVVWFTGAGRRENTTTIVTVCIKGPLSLRKEAIALFYKRFGLIWQENMLASLEKE